MVRVFCDSVDSDINIMLSLIRDSMQACVDDEKNEQYVQNCRDRNVNDEKIRSRKVNPLFDDFPIPTTDLQTSEVPKIIVRVQMKPVSTTGTTGTTAMVRTDYRRVICVLVALFGFLCMSYVVYYHNIIQGSASNSTDTSLHNFNQQAMGDMLIVSFQLQLQGATEPTSKNQADILIPLDSLRSDNHQNFSLYLSSK
jgi:hypothetical protein